MAGNFPDPVDHRIAYDLDGTRLYYNGGLLSAGYVSSCNDEADGVVVGGYGNGAYGLVFPFLMDITGVMARGAGQVNPYGQCYWSPDSLDGYNGTWTAIGGYAVGGGMGGAAHRTGVTSVSLTGVRCIRADTGAAGGQAYIYGIHVYGTYSVSASLDRLEAWHPTLDQRLGGAVLDFGDVPRNSLQVKQFRIKNRSSTLTANTITVTCDSLTDTTPPNSGMHTFSTDGVSYAATQIVTSIAPGAISPILYVKRVTPANAVIALWDVRFKGIVTSWT